MTREELEAENEHLSQQLQEKSEELDTVQENLAKAIDAIKKFHEQQRQLYGEFVTLHRKYAKQKESTRSMLWSYVFVVFRDTACIFELKSTTMQSSVLTLEGSREEAGHRSYTAS